MVSIYRNGLLLSVVLSFVLGVAADVGAGIVSHWSFDEGAGGVALDLIGGIDGTLGGTTAPNWIAGKLGGALDFDRANNQVILAGSNNSVTNLSGARSFSFWTNPRHDGSLSSNGFLGIDNVTQDNRWYIDDNNMGGAIRISGGVGTASNALSYAGNWQHIVISSDSSGSGTKVYANGQLKGSLAGAINYSSLPNTSVLKIGAALHVGTEGLGYRYLDGALDDVAVWDEALTAGQAMALYSLADTADLAYAADKAQQLFALHSTVSPHAKTFAGVTWTRATGLNTDLGKVVQVGDNYLLKLDGAGTGVIGQPDLVAHWKFDDGSGAVAADSAGTCDGTLTGITGTPTWTAGVVGPGALRFTSSDGQFVNVGNNNAVTNLTGDKSLVFWVKPSKSSAQGSNGFLGLDKDASHRWYADDNNQGADVRTYGSGGTTGTVNDVLSYDVWQQVALVDEGSGMQVYVNGLYKGTAGSSYDFSTLTDAIFRIGGARHSGLVVFLEGLMDDVGVWRRALSGPEIMALNSLALSDLNYDQGEAGQLFAHYDAGPGGGELMLDSFWRWEYTTGLNTDPGKLTMDRSNVYFLRLHADGTGLMAIPEPGTFGLLTCALVAMLPGRRRRR